jgi:hypothetical protein
MKYRIEVDQTRMVYVLIDTVNKTIIAANKKSSVLYDHALTLTGMERTASVLNSQLQCYGK